jgi:anion-transporting  ArsA/GET3 family ATPase
VFTAGEQEYAEEKLNTLMKKYKENEDSREKAFEERSKSSKQVFGSSTKASGHSTVPPCASSLAPMPILANPIYRSIAGSLGGAQEYMAIERLHQLWSGGEYDLIIIDTPPSRHAIDLLAAPDRLVTFFSHPVYRVLTLPSRGMAKVTNAGASAFLWAIRRLAGPKVVEDTIEFFRSLSGMEAGLRQRAAETAKILRSESTAFVLVSSPRAEAIDEAAHLSGALLDGGFPLQSIVINLVQPTPVFADGPLPADVPPGPLADLIEMYRELVALHADEEREMATLRTLAGDLPVVEVPLMDDVQDLAGLGALGHILTT